MFRKTLDIAARWFLFLFGIALFAMFVEIPVVPAVAIATFALCCRSWMEPAIAPVEKAMDTCVICTALVVVLLFALPFALATGAYRDVMAAVVRQSQIDDFHSVPATARIIFLNATK